MDDGDQRFLSITSSEIFDYFCNQTETVKDRHNFVEGWTALRVIIGGLLIQGYRIFRRIVS